MEASDLGFDSWFEQKRAERSSPDLKPARVTRVDRDRYLVRNEKGEVQAEPTGRLLYGVGSQQDLPCVGDWVLVQYYNDGALAIIHGVLPRKSFLRRKAPGKALRTASLRMPMTNAKGELGRIGLRSSRS